jgi:hypothetical protein
MQVLAPAACDAAVDRARCRHGRRATFLKCVLVKSFYVNLRPATHLAQHKPRTQARGVAWRKTPRLKLYTSTSSPFVLTPRPSHNRRRTSTARASRSSAATELAQSMQPSVMLRP